MDYESRPLQSCCKASIRKPAWNLSVRMPLGESDRQFFDLATDGAANSGHHFMRQQRHAFPLARAVHTCAVHGRHQQATEGAGFHTNLTGGPFRAALER